MDSQITGAAQALARGDPLGALNRVALRDDAHALALRGIAMAQLGDFSRARSLMKNAIRAFGRKEALARARCIVAEAEIALASRDLGWPSRVLDPARKTLEARGDLANAVHAHYLQIRHLLLTGRIDAATTMLTNFDPSALSPALRTIHELVTAGIAMRRLQAKAARAALSRAEVSAQQASIPALAAEVESTLRELNSPAARLIEQRGERLLQLDEIETLFASNAFIVDACRLTVRHGVHAISLATRPVLFTIVRELAEAWPENVSRDRLIEQAFHIKHADESLRARLRVEIGRLRAALKILVNINATKAGFILEVNPTQKVLVLAPPVEEKHAAVLALLADGEAWSSSAIALALGTSQRTVQRTLEVLLTESKVQSFGRGRARCWLSPPVPEFATTLLLPHSLATD
ncbi:helix-turn-helix domain-containing protein [Sedimenticola hydrogenitrophicus]|uniref:helix-turn-helix domain-containing protein n=1 Tax=Sedimenticola hydrogenitrophicus TaxID=2967975 RepID=UPI0023B14BC7|nr:helix-turn-helix domain-containing protein [Sedimenticola hydrogenitrophicus]